MHLTAIAYNTGRDRITLSVVLVFVFALFVNRRSLARYCVFLMARAFHARRGKT